MYTKPSFSLLRPQLAQNFWLSICRLFPPYNSLSAFVINAPSPFFQNLWIRHWLMPIAYTYAVQAAVLCGSSALSHYTAVFFCFRATTE